MIFRVHGVRSNGSQTFVDIECGSEAVARNAAVREGLVNTTSIETIGAETAHNPVRPRVMASSSTGNPLQVEFSAGSAFKLGFFFALGLISASFVVSLAWLLVSFFFGITFGY